MTLLPSSAAHSLTMLARVAIRLTTLVVLLAVGDSGDVGAQPPGALRLPTSGVSKQSGLALQLQPDGMQLASPGYRTLKAEFTSPSPATADSEIAIRVILYDWNRKRDIISIEANGEFPAGEKTKTLTLRYPQQEEAIAIRWDTWVDGRHDPKLSISDESFVQFPAGPIQGGQPDSLLGWDAGTNVFAAWGRAWNQRTRGGRRIRFVPKVLSAEWRDYVPYDVVRIDIDVLLEQSKSQPKSIAALKKWVSTGGTLWVERAGMNFARLGEINSALAFDETSDAPSPPPESSLAGVHGWNFVDLSRLQSSEEEDGLVADYDPSLKAQIEPNSDEGELEQDKLEPQPVYSRDWFVLRRLGWGRIGVFVTSSATAPQSLDPSLREAGMQLWGEIAWPVRHGLEPGRANADFSNWLIPGVGLAPVVEFQILITLFVLGIGPLNYWLLKRAGRLHLVVLTVPIAAALITGALLAYGILADGFSTRLRTQSITLLDGEQGEAVSWSRLSYYAAFAPRDGLAFNRQALVYPIEPGSNESFAARGSRPPREIVWTEDQQQFTSGWLPARTPTQFLVVEPRETEKNLGVQVEGDTVAVTNNLGQALQLVIVYDEQGGWHVSENLEAGQTTNLTAVEQFDAVVALRDILNNREPRFPDAIDAAQDSALLYESRRQRRRRRSQSLDYSNKLVSASHSLLQRKWQELLGFTGSQPLDLPPKSYLVVSERALFPPTEDDFAVEDSSVHIVIGKW